MPGVRVFPHAMPGRARTGARPSDRNRRDPRIGQLVSVAQASRCESSGTPSIDHPRGVLVYPETDYASVVDLDELTGTHLERLRVSHEVASGRPDSRNGLAALIANMVHRRRRDQNVPIVQGDGLATARGRRHPECRWRILLSLVERLDHRERDRDRQACADGGRRDYAGAVADDPEAHPAGPTTIRRQQRVQPDL